MNQQDLPLVRANVPIKMVMAVIDEKGQGVALVVDENLHLIATVTDGDIRRAILADLDINLPVQVLLDQRTSPTSQPITAHVGASAEDLLKQMNEASIRHIPLLDDSGKVIEMTLLSDLIKEYELPLQAVIMAGGFGTRLRPLTTDVPKPMLPVGDRPLMERMIDQLRRAGIRRMNITTHYHPEKITDYFGDGHAFDVDINYVAEEQPLGTAGALSLLEMPTQPLLVINGDILTQVDFRAMLAFHREQKADLTIGVRQHHVKIAYGVVEGDGPYVQRLREKPEVTFLINAGIYLLEPSVHEFIPNRQHFDMTDLIQILLDKGRPVVSFPIVEYWLDIGQHADYSQAQEDIESGKYVK